MVLKTSIVCLVLILYMCLFYYRKPHLKIKSTKMFRRLIIAAVAASVFDLITVYTVNHRETVPNAVNLAAHIFYLYSILLFAYFLFLYMKSCLQKDHKINRKVQILQSIPVVISTLGILFLPISYVDGVDTDYSAGPKVYSLYISVVFYLVFILYYCLRYWNILDTEKRLAIILAVPIYIIGSAIQMIFMEIFMVVIGITLIMMGLILSNENTEKYMDKKTGLFNQYSFEVVLDEYDFSKRKSVVGVICFCETSDSFDYNRDGQFLSEIQKEMRFTHHIHGYRVCENGAAFLTSSEEKAKSIMSRVEESLYSKFGKENIIVGTKLISKSDYSDKLGLLRIIIGFCRVTGSRFAFIDYLTHIFNRNAFERDLPKAALDKKGYYVIADLNDLKVVNDTIGHSAGDQMLQGFAEILSQAAEDNGRVYRQGGDEFALLYYGDDIDFLLQRITQFCEMHNSSSQVAISYAIGYCPLAEKDFIDTADRLMYENKRAIKGGRVR
ncbi:MAG: GGDEF domain-containing protein [Ruminococcaceae bacterium]|nr:GGDEF domain-containing protein [Oscillospiraceae bacterium]